MSETSSIFPSRLLKVAGIVTALLLSSFSAMVHGGNAEGRLQGPSPWTVWVTLDLLLVVMPVLVPAISFVALLVAGLDRRSSGAIALATWLAAAFGSCVLAVF